MFKKFFLSPIVLSLIGLLLFVGLYFYLKRPPQIPIVKLINQSPVSICFNQDCLQKKDDLWWYQDQFPADQTKVEDLISNLNSISLENLVSNNPDKFEQLGFLSDQPFIVKVGDIVFYLSVLSQNTSYSLIKLADENQIYKTNFIGAVTNLSDSVYWHQDYITNLPSYQINKITASNQIKTVEVNKQDSNWPDQDYIDLISYLSPLDFVSQTQPESNIIYDFNIFFEDNNNQTLYIGQSKDGLYWASIDQQFFYSIDINDFKTLTSILI